MRLIKARVQGYRSVIDSGWFDVESGKTILVGPNEAGKTAIVCKERRNIQFPEKARFVSLPAGIARCAGVRFACTAAFFCREGLTKRRRAM